MVPNGWERKPLEKVAEIRTGVAKGKKGLKDPIEVPYLRVANVQDGHIDLSEVKTIKIERHQLERYSLQVGDVLMTEGGDFDKLGRGDVWQGQITPCLNQNHVFAVRPNNQILLPYFLAALSGSNYGKTYFLSCAKRSTNLASINSTQLKEFPVLLPPLPEQRKISQILSTWDRAIATTEKLIETSKQQKKALMQQLLTGKRRLVNPETGKAFDGEWEHGFLGDLCSFKGGSAFKEVYQGQTSGDYPFIKVSDMNLPKNGKFILQANNWVTEEVAKAIKAKSFSEGSIVFAKVGAALLLNRRRILVQPTIVDNNMMAATPKNCCFTEFLYQLMLMIDFAKFVQDGAVPSVNQSDLSRFKISYPSIEEQQKIASVLTASDKEIEVLEAKLAHFKQEKKALMQQLLTGKRRVTLE
ncbi:restriction endonuclease subunit S [Vibrio parahaemolyticus]|nr:restriction endonuclease subunit S [Vibrio parahaemolyticus]